MERIDHRLSHDWHVAINKFSDAERTAGREWPRFMYDGKELADEVPRLIKLFESERTNTLPKVHQPCSCCAPRPIAKNELTCCLGTKCAVCPILHALEKSGRLPTEIDTMKAWTCVAHILTTPGHVDTSEGYILTTDDRMFWDGVYESLAASSDHPDDDHG